jgi:ATP-dependent DNA ligase
MNINAFLESLADNPSRNFKIDQLSAHRDNETLREVVRLALDPFTQFYQRKIPEYEFVGEDSEHQTSLEMALKNLSYLSNREVTGNAAVAHLRAILSGLSPDDAKVIERVIQKDLKCGVQVGTASSVWSNLVVDYPCMLCSPFEKKLVDKITYPAFVQLKMDGMRFNAIVKHNNIGATVEFRSRNGRELQLQGNLEQEFIEMAGNVDYVFDGELLVEDNGKIADRQTGNGILNKANKGTISSTEAAMVRATVWDMIPLRDFQAGFSNLTYEVRFQLLSSMPLPEKVRLVEHTVVYDIEAAQTIFEDYLAKGQEGIILKDSQGFWENKRAKHQIKFKGELECDLKIVGTEGGTGKYEGMLGAIICESSDGVVKTRVGSGFNDQQRKELVAEDLVGRIVAVKYNMRSVDKQGNHSLFLPIFLELRADKDSADPASLIK